MERNSWPHITVIRDKKLLRWASKTLFGFQMQNHKDLAPICGDFMMWLITHTSPFFSDSSLVQRFAEKGVVAYSQDRLIAK